VIRAATPLDQDWLIETAHSVYHDDFRALLPEVDWAVFDLDFFSARFARDLARVRIACRDGQRSGFSLMTGTHLDMLFVTPAARNAGIGTALLEHATTLECFAVNAAARRFYEREGWRAECFSHRLFGGVDCAFVDYVRR